MTTWTTVTPGSTAYKQVLKGKFYAGNRGIYAGALTIQVGGADIDLYAGYIGTETTWVDVSPDTTVWTDI